MGLYKKLLGAFGEDEAIKLLKKNGYRILERNFRTRFGEIDVIATDKKTLVFVEVKTRSSDSHGSAKHAITDKKKSHLVKASLVYMSRLPEDSEVQVRYDVVAIDRGEDNSTAELIRDAFLPRGGGV
jgi:putative endonuclease